jgi:hypothetical protein
MNIKIVLQKDLIALVKRNTRMIVKTKNLKINHETDQILLGQVLMFLLKEKGMELRVNLVAKTMKII